MTSLKVNKYYLAQSKYWDVVGCYYIRAINKSTIYYDWVSAEGFAAYYSKAHKTDLLPHITEINKTKYDFLTTLWTKKGQ